MSAARDVWGNPLPEMLVVVRGQWRTIAFLSRSCGGAVWWFCDGLGDPDLAEIEQRSIDQRVGAELTHLQSRWRERAEANRRRKMFGADRPLGRVLP